MNGVHCGYRFVGATLLVAAVWVGGGGDAHADEVTVTGDRVNLRAQPVPTSEVVGQVEYGERLVVRSREGDWASVDPPEYVDLWVHRDFVENGRVAVSKLNVRGGPGINYQVIGELNRGDTIDVRGDFGDWLRIAPFADAAVWIHTDYIEPVRPPKAEPPRPPPLEPRAVEPPRPDPARIERPPERDERPPPPRRPDPVARPPPDLALVPLEGQGEEIELEGVVRRVGFLLGRPSSYRLIQYRGNIMETVCFLKGREQQLESLVGQRVVLSGRRYWVQGVRHPVVVPEQIVRRPQ